LPQDWRPDDGVQLTRMRQLFQPCWLCIYMTGIRSKSLINEGAPLSHAVKKQFGYTFKEEQDAEGWLTSAAHIVELIIRDPTNAYRMKCLSLVASSQVKIGRREGVTKEHVGSMIGVLENL